jgi:conjugal transfer pilus assembly protein TraU
MYKTLIIFGVILLFAFPASAIITPDDINFDCMAPFTISKGISFGDSGTLTKLADKYDERRTGSNGAICECKLLEEYEIRIGIPMGMSVPSHIFESTLEPYKFYSLDEDATGEVGVDNDTLDGYGAMDKENEVGSLYTYTHLINLNIFLLLDIFTDSLCVKSDSLSPLDIGYLSEIDPMAEDSSTANYVFPEAVLVANTMVVLSCVADSAATLIGLTFDPMYWCVGGHAIFPASNHTQEGTSADDAAMQNIIKTMYRLNRITIGSTFKITTAPVTTSESCEEVESPLIIKSQYRMQPAMPFVLKGLCPRLGAPSILWNTPKKSLNGNMAVVIWTRKDCCAL